MPHGEMTPVYLQFSLPAEDIDKAALIYGHAAYRAKELGRVSRVIAGAVHITGDRRIVRIVYESTPAKVRECDMIDWETLAIICRSCLGRGETTCPMCRGSGAVGKVAGA